MSFVDLFDSGFKKRNEDHFASLVRVAMDDGVITDEERAFLERVARSLDVSKEEYEVILKDYKSHPINPPTLYNNRLERLYDLSRMVFADHIRGEHEEALLRKIALGLGFTPENVNYIVDKALNLVEHGVDLDTFMEEIKLMNR